MEKNNFQILEELQMKEIDFDSTGIKNKIDSSIDIYKTISNVLELYIPQLAKTAVDLMDPNSK